MMDFPLTLTCDASDIGMLITLGGSFPNDPSAR